MWQNDGVNNKRSQQNFAVSTFLLSVCVFLAFGVFFVVEQCFSRAVFPSELALFFVFAVIVW